ICGRYNPITNDDIIWRGMHRFLEDGKPVPMGALFALYGLLSGTSDGFTKGPIIFWTPNSNYGEMMYRNMTRVTLGHLANAYADTVRSIRGLLKAVLKPLASSELPLVETLVDHCNDPANNHSFLTNPANNLTQYSNALFTAKCFGGEFMDLNGGPVNRDAMIKWRHKVSVLVKKFLFAIHLSGGQPARATELNTLMIKDWDIQKRGLYIVEKRIALATRYWKGQALYGKDKHVLRLLPKDLGELLLKYLVFVKPCEVAITSALACNKPKEVRAAETAIVSHYLFTQMGHEFSDDLVRTTFAKLWKKSVGYKLTFQDMRHIMQAFLMSNCTMFRTSVNSELVEEEGDHFQDRSEDYRALCERAKNHKQFCAMASQAAHTAHVAELNYAISSEGIRLVMEQQLLNNCKTSMLWQEILLSKVDQTKYPTEWPRIPKSAWSKMSVNAYSTEHGLIGVSAGALVGAPVAATGPPTTVNVAQTFQTFSCVYPERTSSRGSGGSSSSSNRDEIVVRRGQGDISEHTRHTVQEKLIEHSQRTGISTFNSQQQKDSVCRLVEEERDMLVVLPTGGGKSFIFQLASLIDGDAYPGRFTLVVSPLKALTQNIYDECLKHGVPCMIWSRGSLRPIIPGIFTGIVVAAVESLEEDRFADFLLACQANNNLRRVVIDEAHLYPVWKHFRSAMGNVKTALSRVKQLVLFSATVPPRFELDLFKNFRYGLATRREDVDIIRAPTARPNISYSVHMCRGDLDAMRALADVVNSEVGKQRV
ncbi:hypothetical protein LPJ60_006082, partial [Coemansia sp. RSA 2675]